MAALEIDAAKIRASLLCRTVDPETGTLVASHSRRQISEGIPYCSERDVRRIRDMFTSQEWKDYPDYQYSWRGKLTGTTTTCPDCGLEYREKEVRHVIPSQKDVYRGQRLGDAKSGARSNERRRRRDADERKRVMEMIDGTLSTGGVVGKFATGNRHIDPVLRIHNAITEFSIQLGQALTDLENGDTESLLQEYYGRAGTPRSARLTVHERLTGQYGKMLRLQSEISHARVHIEELAREERKRFNGAN